jgi:hypothetical protein
MLVLGTEAFGEIKGVGGVGAHGIGCICCDNLLLLDSSGMLSQWNGKKIMRKEDWTAGICSCLFEILDFIRVSSVSF